ncbi:hypothetical protein XELAEV_18021966mg [Xenopus laevis]|uniref:Coiled-coil domain-containing protein 73 n=1 Tax=Xenopus laevis TaxID=8355 RepID=A0A974D2J7_XENLA|nr:hypothetical protein XELAEV_18021966mg [Xenopus laevis]
MDATPYTFQASSETMFASQLLEFKTSLIEAAAELHMGRSAKIQYEEQMSKVMMEKQDLLWQNETLSNQTKNLDKQHTEAVDALKKQGQIQLAVEAKGKEIGSLKEELKALQMLNSNLQKKLHEMEQKAQLHMVAKEDHIRQLSEFERCYANITCQFAIAKDMHEKLEQNVQEAIQQNHKLMSENKEKNSESDHLREELRENSVELMKYKVMCEKQADEEKHILTEKEQQLRELQNKLLMETEVNKKLSEANLSLKDEKQEALRSLFNMMELIQRYSQTIQHLEIQLTSVEKDYQALERDNELQRAKAKENEEKFLALQSEHEKALEMQKKQDETVTLQTDTKSNEQESANKKHKDSPELESEDMRTIVLSQDQPHPSSMIPDLKENLCKSEYLQSENTAELAQVKSMEEIPLENCSSSSTAVKEILAKKAIASLSDPGDDPNGSQRVYNKGLGEEQKDEFNFSKVKFPASQDFAKQSCEVEFMEETPTNEINVKSAKVPPDNNKRPSQPEDSCNDVYGDDRSNMVHNAENGRSVDSQLFPPLKKILRSENFSAKAKVTSGKSISCLIQAGNPYQSHAQNWSPPKFHMVSSRSLVYKQYQKDLEDENPTVLFSDIPAAKETCTDDRNTLINEENPNKQVLNVEESPLTPPITVQKEENGNLQNTPVYSPKSHSLSTDGPTVGTARRNLDNSEHGDTLKSNLSETNETLASGYNSTACHEVKNGEWGNPNLVGEETKESVVSYNAQETTGGNVPGESCPTLDSGKSNSAINTCSGEILEETDIMRPPADASALRDHPTLKSYHSAEWSAVAQIYQDVSKRQPPASPELPSEGKVGRSCSKLQDKVSEIEKLLFTQRLSGVMKRKLAEDIQMAGE